MTGTAAVGLIAPVARIWQASGAAVEGANPYGGRKQAEKFYPAVERGIGAETVPSQDIVYRKTAPPAAPQAAAGKEPEGEDVFKAQEVTAERTQALNRVFSYQAPQVRSTQSGLEPAGPASQSGAEESINYNRLTEELMVRIERRLRAERRKFGL